MDVGASVEVGGVVVVWRADHNLLESFREAETEAGPRRLLTTLHRL